MKYEVWVWDNSIKRIIMKFYNSYKEAKKIGNLFASEKDTKRVEIYGRETLKDITEDD